MVVLLIFLLNVQTSVGQLGEEESRGRELGEGGKRKRPQSGRGDLLIFLFDIFLLLKEKDLTLAEVICSFFLLLQFFSF